MITLKESLADAMQIMLDTISFNAPEGITTGYPELDNLTRGMRKGSLTVLASPPSLGKTALALNIVGNLMGRKPEMPVLYCSGLSHTELTFRLLTILSGVTCGYDRDLHGDEISRLTECITERQSYPLFFEENGISFEKITGICSEKHIGFLIFDPVRQENFAELKRLTQELDIPVLALVSIRKDTTDIMESADTAIHLVRDRHETRNDQGAPVSLLVARNRFGLCGTCRLNYIPQTMQFRAFGNEIEDAENHQGKEIQ
jgi:replicative DNA helicase